MQTHFLSKEQVQAYLADLANRLRDMKALAPSVICPIGYSGSVLLRELYSIAPDLIDRTLVARVANARASGESLFDDGGDHDFEGKRVLVIDSSVHSGMTMRGIVTGVLALGAKAVCSYTLVLKRGALFTPSFWGLMIDDHDRAYFLLKELPNNRLSVTAPYVHIRKLSEADRTLPPLATGLAFDNTTWGERYDLMAGSDRKRLTYLLEDGTRLGGWITFLIQDKYVWVQELGIAPQANGKSAHYAEALLRWAETNARHSSCEEVRVWVPASEALQYKRCGYRSIARARPRDGGADRRLMAKKVLYHI
jgi:hypoxanthine-guanine phosphoribosyltransferase